MYQALSRKLLFAMHSSRFPNRFAPSLFCVSVVIFLIAPACNLRAQDQVDVAVQVATRPLALRPLDNTFAPEPPSIDNIIGDVADAKQPRVDDQAFIRRASLDLVGLLPTADAVEKFAADSSVDKREKLVDILLGEDQVYAEHWLTFWNDLLRNDYSGTGYIDGGRAPITAWLYRSLRENKPYDQLVRELIVPTTDSEGFSRGIKWRGRINASQVVELQFAQNVGQVFLGLNLKCASCHDSFVDSLKLTDAYGLAAVVAESLLEIHRCDVPQGSFASAAFLYPELGTIDPAASRPERLEQLAELLTKKENGRFSRTVVNRLWQKMMGRGLVEPMDSMDSPAWNEQLLDWLAADLIEHKYDLKQTLKTIASSNVYQLPTVAPPEPGADFEFRGPLARRLTAEQWLDGIWQLTEQWPRQPATDFGDRAGRPVRASLVNADRLMRVLGRPNREQVVTNRPTSLTTLEAIDLINGAQLATTLDQGAATIAARFKDAPPTDLVRWLYRASLSRDPTDAELETATMLLGSPIQKEPLADLLWVIVLQPEFCFVR